MVYKHDEEMSENVFTIVQVDFAKSFSDITKNDVSIKSCLDNTQNSYTN
jgi:hypothetical protein